MPFTKEELNKIRKELPKGSQKEIAKNLCLSHGNVRNVMGGLSKNDDVVIEAIRMIVDHKNKVDSAKTTLENA